MASNQNAGMAMLPGSATDFDVQGAAIARKRAVAEAMLKKAQEGMGQGQMIGKQYVPPHWSEGLAQLYNAYAGKQDLKSADEEQTKLSADYQSGLGEAIKNHLKTQEGTPASLVQGQGPLANDAPDNQLDVNPAVAPDRRKAMIDAMTSQFKPMQELGKAEFAQSGKQTMGLKDIYGLAAHYTPESVNAYAQTGDPTKLVGMKQTTAVNGQLLENQTGATVKDARDQFNPPGLTSGPNGDVLTQTVKGTNETKAIGGGGVTVNTGDKGANAFQTEGNKEVVKGLVESKSAAMKAHDTYNTLANAQTLLGELKGGMGANVAQTAKRVGEMLGLPYDGSIQAQQQVIAALKQQVLANIKQLGSGSAISDADRKFTEDMVGANPELSKDMLEKSIHIGLLGAVNQGLTHKAAIANASDLEGFTPALQKAFDVPLPSFDFKGNTELDPHTGKFYSTMHQGSGVDPRTGQPGVPDKGVPPPTGGMTTQQKLDRIKELERKHGIGG